MTAADQALNDVYAQDALRMQYLADTNKLNGRWRDRFDELMEKHGCVESIYDTLLQEMLGQTSEQMLNDKVETLAEQWGVNTRVNRLVGTRICEQ